MPSNCVDCITRIRYVRASVCRFFGVGLQVVERMAKETVLSYGAPDVPTLKLDYTNNNEVA